VSFFVHKGVAAIKVSRYWIGFAAGNYTTGKRRRTVERALHDVQGETK
jgi:hypothetical protein